MVAQADHLVHSRGDLVVAVMTMHLAAKGGRERESDARFGGNARERKKEKRSERAQKTAT